MCKLIKLLCLIIITLKKLLTITNKYVCNQFKTFLFFHLTLFLILITAARNHVNRLCLAAGVILIESGSAGYLGQVTVIRKVI